MTKKSSPEHHHFTFFAIPETIIFKISLISTRSSPPHGRLSLCSAAPWVSGRPECQPDVSWQFRRSSAVRRPTFSRSKWLKLGPETRIATLDRGARSGVLAHFSLCRGTYLPKFVVSTEYPPPPPPPPGGFIYNHSKKSFVYNHSLEDVITYL